MKRVGMVMLMATFPLLDAKADTVFGVYAGAQGWRMATDGGFSNTSDIQSFNFGDETQNAFHIAVEHPFPLIPNIKVRRTSLDTQGNINLTQPFTFGGQAFSADTSLSTNIDVTHTDLILYYELLDNNLFSFDFGLNGKYIDGDILAQGLDDTVGLEADIGTGNFSGIVPLLYSKVQIGVPFTGWGAYAEGSFLAIDGNTLYDYQVALSYALVGNFAVDVGLEFGYRSLRLELDDVDDITTDLDFDGVFAGIEIHF